MKNLPHFILNSPTSLFRLNKELEPQYLLTLSIFPFLNLLFIPFYKLDTQLLCRINCLKRNIYHHCSHYQQPTVLSQVPLNCQCSRIKFPGQSKQINTEKVFQSTFIEKKKIIASQVLHSLYLNYQNNEFGVFY